jgi:hypothetical protein
MRGFVTMLGLMLTLAAMPGTAFAAEARSGNSGLAVGIFLAFCALIVVAQLLPALRSRFLARLKPQTEEEEALDGARD